MKQKRISALLTVSVFLVTCLLLNAFSWSTVAEPAVSATEFAEEYLRRYAEYSWLGTEHDLMADTVNSLTDDEKERLIGSLESEETFFRENHQFRMHGGTGDTFFQTHSIREIIETFPEFFSGKADFEKYIHTRTLLNDFRVDYSINSIQQTENGFCYINLSQGVRFYYADQYTESFSGSEMSVLLWNSGERWIVCDIAEWWNAHTAQYRFAEFDLDAAIADYDEKNEPSTPAQSAPTESESTPTAGASTPTDHIADSDPSEPVNMPEDSWERLLSFCCGMIAGVAVVGIILLLRRRKGTGGTD